MISRKATAVSLASFFLVIGFFLFSAAFLCTASAAAQKPIEMRMAHYQPEQRVLMVGAKWWADEVQKRTNGRIMIKHYFSEQLARAKEIVPLVGRGGIELGTPALTYHVSEFPLMQLLIDYPWADLRTLFWIVPRLVDTVPALQNEWKKNNILPLSFGGLPPYGIATTKNVKNLGDLTGLKIRVWGKTLPMRMIKIGMIPVTMPSSETYEAMAKGTAECSMSPLDQHRTLGLWEIAKYHLEGDFIPALYAAQPIMNQKLFNSLEPDLRKILMDLRGDHLKKLEELVVATDAADKKFLKEHGVNFPALSKAENKRLEEDAIEAWNKMADELKVNKEDVKAIKAAIERLKADYAKTR